MSYYTIDMFKYNIVEILILSIFIVMLRRMILNITEQMPSRPLRNGFNANCIILWSSIFIPYFLTHNINLALISFLLSLMLRTFFVKIFYTFPNTHIINDLGLFIWCMIILYLSYIEKDLALQINIFN